MEEADNFPLKIAYFFCSCLPDCRQAGFYEGLNFGIEELKDLGIRGLGR
jgi:hypothetical protein